MIRSLKDKRIPALRAGQGFKGFQPDPVVRAQRELAQPDAAQVLADLSVPPSNRLEPLKDNRHGQWSIRINDQWRLCFRFEGGDAHDVEIANCH